MTTIQAFLATAAAADLSHIEVFAQSHTTVRLRGRLCPSNTVDCDNGQGFF